MCLFVRFTPKEKFCASKPSFNSQVFFRCMGMLFVTRDGTLLCPGNGIDKTVGY